LKNPGVLLKKAYIYDSGKEGSVDFSPRLQQKMNISDGKDDSLALFRHIKLI
jgi:hypothetical protein